MSDLTGGQSGTQTGGYTLEIVMISFFTLAYYNAIELLFQIFFAFKQHKGLYFWSMLVATCGIPIHVTGFILKYWVPAVPWAFSVTLMQIGWVSFISGQSMVLYSRLHLVLFNRRIRRLILIMIIVDGILLHTFCTVVTYGSNSSMAASFTVIYSFLEKLQMTWFSLQEVIISGTYVWAILKLLSPARTNKSKMLRHLIYVNIFVVFLDVVLLCLVYSNLYELETSLKPGIYSVKLKLEFAVLNQLLYYTRTSANDVGRNKESERSAGRRHQSTICEPPRDHVFAGASHLSQQSQQSHAGILRTTTIMVGSDDKASKSLASPSQDPIVKNPSLSNDDEESQRAEDWNKSDESVHALPEITPAARRSISHRESRDDHATTEASVVGGTYGYAGSSKAVPAWEVGRGF